MLYHRYASLRYKYDYLIRLSTSAVKSPVNFYSTQKTVTNLKWPSYEIRQNYLDYFCRQNNHKFLPSSSVLPKKGSGTYFTNSGMNQFKSIILGEVKANEIIDLSKYIGVANSQKCIRIGGKHSDLDDIGKDTYHHTFFEMLGNWSFGSYNKEETCSMALELLVNVYKLDINGLYFTYFGGDEKLCLEADLETKNIWLKLGVKEEKLLPFGMKENFWEMDVVGPCGPCTEIHYDRNVNSGYDSEQMNQAKALVNAGTEQVIELWNLVFMQYNRLSRSKFTRLPSLVVDTGMGLERLTAVLNGLDSNYESDLFQPLFDKIHSHCEHNGIPEFSEGSEHAYGYKVLADHMRSISFSISDGLLPSRNGLGGFLKYLILKSLKVCNEIFKVEDSSQLMCELVPLVIDSFRGAYPEIANKSEYIQKVIRQTSQKQTEKYKYSRQVTERYLKKLNNPRQLSGEQIWKLFKGDGKGEEIPVEFIVEFCAEKQIQLDLDAYDKLYLAENENALKTLKNYRKDNSKFIELASMLKQRSIQSTDNSDRYKYQLDTADMKANYHSDTGSKSMNSKLLAIATETSGSNYTLNEQLEVIQGSNKNCILVLDRTNFYPEGGGQVSDVGQLTFENGIVFHVNNVQHIQDYSFHTGELSIDTDNGLGGRYKITVNDTCQMNVDARKRYDTTMNHTAVHLLNHAIRKHFKSESSINQLSSNVKSAGFKFEFSFSEILDKPTSSDINSIQAILKNLIEQELPIYTTETSDLESDLAKFPKVPLRRLKDVLYPLKVRVVSVGAPWQDHVDGKESEDFSAELCCGSHATNTNQLKEIVIRSFSANGDSTYEIEACTSETALEALENDKAVQRYLSEMRAFNNLKNDLDKSDKVSIAELNYYLNQIADRSIQIESIFKSQPTSYTVMHQVKQESALYRPSKSLLNNVLTKYFEQELSNQPTKTSNVLSISTIDSKVQFKFLAFESILTFDQILKILRSIKDLAPVLILYNKYRANYFLYAKEPIQPNGEIDRYFSGVQDKISAQYEQIYTVDSKPNYRVLKCTVNQKVNYFTF